MGARPREPKSDRSEPGRTAEAGLAREGDGVRSIGHSRLATMFAMWSPLGLQLGLGAEQAGASDDQPPGAVAGLGDLRLAVVGVRCVRAKIE